MMIFYMRLLEFTKKMKIETNSNFAKGRVGCRHLIKHLRTQFEKKKNHDYSIVNEDTILLAEKSMASNFSLNTSKMRFTQKY